MHYYNILINLFELLIAAELKDLAYYTLARRIERIPRGAVPDASSASRPFQLEVVPASKADSASPDYPLIFGRSNVLV